jgi:hypothetical protein
LPSPADLTRRLARLESRLASNRSRLPPLTDADRCFLEWLGLTPEQRHLALDRYVYLLTGTHRPTGPDDMPGTNRPENDE